MELRNKKSVIGFVGAVALFWGGVVTDASVPPFKKPDLAPVCKDSLQEVSFAGSFWMPGTNERMNLFIGKQLGKKGKLKTVGLIGNASQPLCEAQCKVLSFDRYQKDFKPQFIEMECQSTRLKTLRMPVFIEWVKQKNSNYTASIRLGSSLFEVAEAPLTVETDAYTVKKGIGLQAKR